MAHCPLCGTHTADIHGAGPLVLCEDCVERVYPDLPPRTEEDYHAAQRGRMWSEITAN